MSELRRVSIHCGHCGWYILNDEGEMLKLGMDSWHDAYEYCWMRDWRVIS